MSKFTTLNLPTFTDPLGSLTVLQRELPFAVVRTYWIYGADGKTRGGHRHTFARQALVAIVGKVSIYLNDGVTIDTIDLNDPGKCLLVETNVWHTMKFGEGAVLLVMSSSFYDRNDYIDIPYE